MKSIEITQEDLDRYSGAKDKRIAAVIREKIRNGELQSGDKLPTKRRLAAVCGNALSAERAYAQLVGEGMVVAKERLGYFVADGVQKIPAKQEEQLFLPEEECEASDGVIDLSSRKSDPSGFPFEDWNQTMRRVLKDRQSELVASSPVNGLRILREAIADHLLRFRDMRTSPEQIVVGSGAEYLYGLLVHLLGDEKSYAVENPSQHTVGYCLAPGAVNRYVNLDESGLRIDELQESGADVAHVSPAHQFPTGIVMPYQRRQELLLWASEEGKDRYIIEDEYDSEFRYSGRPLPTLQSLDRNGRVIYVNTFTKTLASGVRVGYMVLPKSLLEKYRSQFKGYSCTVSNFIQVPLAEFIISGAFRTHLGRRRRHYAQVNRRVLEIFREKFNEETVRIEQEESGLHCVVKFTTRNNLPDRILAKLFRDVGVRLQPLAEYCRSAKDQGTRPSGFLLRYANLDIEKDLPEALDRIAGVLEEYDEI